jgi:hypothetical protein
MTPGRVGAFVHHSMRAYYIPLVAGVLLGASAFLPWVVVGGVAARGLPGIAGLWTLGLGAFAVVLSSLSIATRKNSRHPLLVVGLAALAIMALTYRMMARSAVERAWAVAQALAIVEDRAAPAEPVTSIGSGVYLGLAASAAIVLFGLTIVVRQVSRPYVDAEDDDL